MLHHLVCNLNDRRESSQLNILYVYLPLGSAKAVHHLDHDLILLPLKADELVD